MMPDVSVPGDTPIHSRLQWLAVLTELPEPVLYPDGSGLATAGCTFGQILTTPGWRIRCLVQPAV